MFITKRKAIKLVLDQMNEIHAAYGSVSSDDSVDEERRRDAFMYAHGATMFGLQLLEKIGGHNGTSKSKTAESCLERGTRKGAGE